MTATLHVYRQQTPPPQKFHQPEIVESFANVNLFLQVQLSLGDFLEKPLLPSKMLVEKCRIPTRNFAEFSGFRSDKIRIKNRYWRFTRKKTAPRKIGKIVDLLGNEFQ